MKVALRRYFFLLWCLLSGPGCQKDSTPAIGSNAGAPQQTIPATVRPVVVNETADISLVLASLTDAVRRYSLEKRNPPADLNEVVSAGYMSGMPPAPAGKKFVINSRREVELVNQ